MDFIITTDGARDRKGTNWFARRPNEETAMLVGYTVPFNDGDGIFNEELLLSTRRQGQGYLGLMTFDVETA